MESKKERTWLIDLRKQKNLTQYDLAGKADITRPYYTMIEKGTKTPSPKVAQNISDILDFDWTYFFTTGCNYKSHQDGKKVTTNP